MAGIVSYVGPQIGGEDIGRPDVDQGSSLGMGDKTLDGFYKELLPDGSVRIYYPDGSYEDIPQ